MYKKIVFGALFMASSASYALENGVSVYPQGAENFMVGAVPPPGFRSMVYLSHYEADRLNDHKGNKIDIPNFNIKASSISTRFAYVVEKEILGGNLVLDSIFPFVSLETTMAGQTDKEEGLGDVLVGLVLGHHHSPKLHTVAILDVYLPTGDFKKDKQTNIGTNRLTIEPAYGVTYLDGKYNFDVRMGYLINGKNSDTDYKSGDEFHLDYAAGLTYNDFTVGVGGYYQQQLKNDEVNGQEILNSKAKGFAIGPSIKYQKGPWFATFKYQKELVAENKTQGDAFWIKAVVPF